MNCSKNQQYRRTEQKFQQILLDLLKEKPLNRITVREICGQAGVNRSTFYEHYADIYDMMEKSELAMAQGLGEKFQVCVNAENFLMPEIVCLFFEYIFENQEFYKYYLTDCSRDTIALGFKYIRDNFVKPCSLRYGLKKESWISYYAEFFLSGTIAMIQRWLEDGCRETPQEMASCLLRAFPDWPVQS